MYNRYCISIYCDGFSIGGTYVSDEPDSRSLKNKLFEHEGDFVEFTTEKDDFIQVRKSLINGIHIYNHNNHDKGE